MLSLFSKRSLIRRYGSLTHHNGRWHYYRTFYPIISMTDDDQARFPIPFELHRVDSNPKLWRLFYGRRFVKTWYKMVCPTETTKVLIDWTRTDLFLPGLQYSEFVKDVPGHAAVVVAYPLNEDDVGGADFTVCHVAFEDHHAATIWKLTQ